MFRFMSIKILFFILFCIIVQSCNSDYIEYEVNGVKFRMLEIEGGLFLMGNTKGQGFEDVDGHCYPHKVRIDNYFIGETEVSQKLWIAVMDNNPSYFKNENVYDNPVESVSWNDVQVFIKKLNDITNGNFRLPSEEEWEYAARGGSKSTDKRYSGSDSINDVAWYIDNSNGYPQSIASKKPNELGLYDMSGNVWEWCDTEENGKYIERGGGWANSELGLRVSFRDRDSADYKNYNGGFRLAMSVIP